jgi:protease I
MAKRRPLSRAWALTCVYLGSYYRTYPTTVEDEVRAALANPDDFISGPTSISRDSPTRLSAGFTVRDGNYLSARWPGDAHRFASDFATIPDNLYPRGSRGTLWRRRGRCPHGCTSS